MKLLFFMGLILGITSCQTSLLKVNKEVPGQWFAKVLVKNHKNNSNQILDMDILSIYPYPIRLELSTSLGIHLASIVLREKFLQISLSKQKKFYEGKPTPSSLIPILKVMVDPQLIPSAIYQIPIPNWECHLIEEVLESCNSKQGHQIIWEKSTKGEKRVNLSGPDFEIDIVFKKYIERPDLPDKTFVLKYDEDFQKIKLQ